MPRAHLIKPVKPSPVHRYRPAEVSGPLPDVLYKVLPPVFARRLVEHGEMMWSTIDWFQNLEAAERGDRLEGAREYFPVGGLQVHRSERDGKPDDTTFTVPSFGIHARALHGRHIFVYSMTVDATLRLGDPAECAVVTIFDPARFVEHVRVALAAHAKARPSTFIHDRMSYWLGETPPAEVLSLADRLVMTKHNDFAHQQEYRLAFGTRANVFDFEAVQSMILTDDFRMRPRELEPQRHRLKLRIGSLGDCCRL